MALPTVERIEHKTVRIIKNGHTTFTVIEREEGNGLLLQHTTKAMEEKGDLLTKADLLHYADAPFWSCFRVLLLVLFWLAVTGLTGGAIFLVVQSGLVCQTEPWTSGWWKHSLIYQIHVKSFQDSDSDGYGDLAGVTSRLDYIQSIGVDAILLNPVFKGVDGNSLAVVNFTDIDPTIGTLADFDTLVREAHQRNIMVVIDFVVTHTAVQHPWFPYSQGTSYAGVPAGGAGARDYYVWHDGNWDNSQRLVGGAYIAGLPNQWTTTDDNRISAWTWSPSRQQYYLHQYNRSLPNLNYASEALRGAMDDVLRYWIGRDVDGFRFLNIKDMFYGPGRYSVNASNPILPAETKKLLRRWRNIIDSPWSGSRQGITKLLMVDGDGVSVADAAPFGVNLVFNRNLMKCCTPSKKPGLQMAALVEVSLKSAFPKSPTNWATGNYDEHRASMRLGSFELVDALNIIALLLPGAGVVFYGDEIGILDGDPSKYPKRSYLSEGTQITPMRWSSAQNAGFTKASVPYRPVNIQFANVQNQLQQPHSILKIFQQLAVLRRTDAIRYGSYRQGAPDDTIFSFIRQAKSGGGFLIIADLRQNGFEKSHPRDYSLAWTHLSRTGLVVWGSGSLYSSKNQQHSSLAFPHTANATLDLSSSIVLRESEVVVMQFF